MAELFEKDGKVTRSRFRNQFNWRRKDSFSALSSKPDKCVADDAYSIGELLKRHASGLLTDVRVGRNSKPVFAERPADFDDPDLEKFDRSDPVDQEVVVTDLKARGVVEKDEVEKYRKAEEERATAEREAEEKALFDRLQSKFGKNAEGETVSS